jgi:hypothetical protein
MHDKDKDNDTDSGFTRTRAASPAQMLRALLRRLSGARAEPQPLLPPGRRSGRGSESLEPYLKHGRDSAPGPLE